MCVCVRVCVCVGERCALVLHQEFYSGFSTIQKPFLCPTTVLYFMAHSCYRFLNNLFLNIKIRIESFCHATVLSHSYFPYATGLRFNCFLGPLIFTIVNMKRRPATTNIVSYDMDSCPFVLVVAILQLY